MKKNFIEYCLQNKFQKNTQQLETLDLLIFFFNQNYKNKIKNFFSKKKNALGFYLHGDVGVGKTMLLNFFFGRLNIKKKRFHFNEFMLNFHDYRHKRKVSNKDSSIDSFIKKLKKKADLIYFDEFQVTNIVDAMILGQLFETIFKEKIKVLISSNIKIKDLYKDGLQREQFIPFIKIIKKFCIEHELVIGKDYRKLGASKKERFFSPMNENTIFHVNQIFRQLSKGKVNSKPKLNIKKRDLIIDIFFEGIARFDFNSLCANNLGAEDYIAIVKKCNFIIIDNIPNFDEEKLNLQQRFITLIDIIYEKKIPMMVSSSFNLDNYTSSKN